MHLHDLGKVVKQAVIKQDMLAWQFNTIGVSDAITMGGPGESRPRYDAIVKKMLMWRRNALLPPIQRDYCGLH